MNYEYVSYEAGPVTRISLNRPELRNAQGWAMIAELDDAFQRYTFDPSARIAILTGAGEHFSSGHDRGSPDQLAARAPYEERDDALTHWERTRAVYVDSAIRLRNVPKPTLAMVQGYCIWGGWLLASAMDVIFASDDALFLPGYVRYFSIPWDLGARKTKEILYENRFVSATEAYDLGFVNRVYPLEKLEQETLRYAEAVAENSPRLTRLVKYSVNNALDNMGFTQSIAQASHSTVGGVGSADATDEGAARRGQRPAAGVRAAFERMKRYGVFTPRRPYGPHDHSDAS